MKLQQEHQIGNKAWLMRDAISGTRYVMRQIPDDRVSFHNGLLKLQTSGEPTPIPRIHYVGQSTHGTCVIEEFVERAVTINTLAADIRGRPDRVALLLGACCLALWSLHRHVIHGDIKPENMLARAETNPVYIVDMETANWNTTGTIPCCGYTPLYASIEQVQHGYACPASDVRALGLGLIELYLGRHPFEAHIAGLSEPMIADKVARMRLRPTNNTPVLRILARMVAVDPVHRPSVEQVIRELQEISDSNRISARRVSSDELIARRHHQVV